MNKYLSKIKIVLLLFLILLVTSSLFMIIQYYKKTYDTLKQNYINELKTEYAISIGIYSTMADSIFNLNINKKNILELFSEGVNETDISKKNKYREMLYYTLLESYTKLKEYNFRQLHFHEKNNKSYLRFHRPEKFGDDLTGIRYSVEYANKGKKYLAGFEEGRIFNGYRFIYPLTYNNIHQGSVEISISMKTVIDQISKQFNKESQFIILKDQVLKKVFSSEQLNYSIWAIDNDYVMDREISDVCILSKYISEKDKLKIQEKLKQNKREPFCMEINHNKIHSVVSFIPIINFMNEPVAFIFSVSQADKLISQKKSFYIVFVLLLFLIISLTVFTAYYRYSSIKMENMASHDFLTKVYTRRFFFQLLASEYERCIRYIKTFSILMIDIDHFKKVNDTFGHQTGDIVLSGIADILRNKTRKTDIIGRYGGEEFIILLPETSLKDAVSAAENFRQEISAHEFHKIGIKTISCGISEFQSNMSIEEIINIADKKLYEAKTQGRNRVIA